MYRALDLFCCAGGATKGLQRAGFHVTGVDIKPQPHYCGNAFYCADALTFPLGGFDFIWASPPCQGYSAMRHAPGAIGAAKLIEQVRVRLQDSHQTNRNVVWVIENVEQAKSHMLRPVLLCGSMFGLASQGCQLQRHRLFESNMGYFQYPYVKLECSHDERPVIGVYGGHARKRAASAGGRGTRDVWEGGHKAAASEALGIDWMTLGEMSEAIPPAYAEFIGREAIKHIEEHRVAA